MARDPIIGDGFTPSIQVDEVSRAPKADILDGVWRLEGFEPHYGPQVPAGELCGWEPRIIFAIIEQFERTSFAKPYDFRESFAYGFDAVDINFWICSAMVKFQVNTIRDLIAVAQANDGEKLMPVDAGVEVKRRVGMGPLVGM